MKAKHMRFLVLLAVLMLLVSLVGAAAYAAGTNPAAEPVCYKHGDVNLDDEITGEDAVYLLFASFDMFKDEYPLEQNGDIDENNQFDGDDAVYLLFASFDMFKDEYPLKGTVHNYYDPLWTWDTAVATPTAQVSLKCACGQPHTITEGITVTPGTVIEPTCVTTGSKEYTATVTYNGTVFTDTVTVVLDAKGTNGHEFNGVATCENGIKCNNCDYTLPALDHSYELMDTEKVEGCKHTKRYKCSACQREVDGAAAGDVYYTHSYTAKILQEATCSVKGTKLLTCACGHSYQEDIAKNDSHTWEKGSTVNGVTTYSCACGATKTVVEVTNDQAVSAEALKDNEVKLEGGTTVALDEKTADQLDTSKTIKINVEAVKADEVQLEGNQKLDADTKEQIGQNDIYNFSMTYSDGTAISDFEGMVTVALPYTLQDGDDVNSIDVWYIADDGSIECVKGVYSNGYVTFQTDHFSYYTVTRLTPAQRCEVYGHVELTTSKAATCTEDGYTKVYCQRCAAQIEYEKIPMLGHNYVKDTQKSKAATCNTSGVNVEVCQKCNHEKSEQVKQLTHVWEKTETVAAGCTTKGYEKYACQLCGKTKVENEQTALGHAWGVAENGWQWSADKSKATLTLTCANGSHDPKVLTAVITKEGEASVCLGGEVTYTAKVCFNGAIYENTVVDAQTGLGHTPGANWETDAKQHYRLCSVCGEKIGQAEHQWERTVNTPATCGKTGSATDKCAICGKEEPVVLPINGEHNFVKGTCTICGKQADTCDHTLVDEVIDLGKLGACQGSLTIRSCACGKIVAVVNTNITCDFVVVYDGYDETAGRYVYKEQCKVCGLMQEGYEDTEYNANDCTSTHGYTSSLVMNGNVLASAMQKYHTSYHPAKVKCEFVDFAEYGMCGGVWQRVSCYCGERSVYDIVEEIKCEFDEETGICAKCGTKYVYTEEPKHVGCSDVYEWTYAYSRNGVTVLTLADVYIETFHEFVTDSFKMYGDTCEDGVVLNQRCAKCGETDACYSRSCNASILKETIDTTGMGFCTDALELYTCPCGSYTDYYMNGDGDHDWGFVSEEGDTFVSACAECGYTRTRKITIGEKDENCKVQYTVVITFADDKGHNFGVTYQYTGIEHEYVYDYELKGDSCEDGVTITETCKDCDYRDQWTTYHHDTINVEELDLSAYGFCGDTVYRYACPCGEDSGIGGMYYCLWEHFGYEYTEQGEIYWERCPYCGIVREQLIVSEKTDDPCYKLVTRSYKFYKDDQLLGQISNTEKEGYHRYVYQLTLKPGATSCDDGFIYVETCVDCGQTHTGEGYHCSQYVIAREKITGLCGELELLTRRCACGERISAVEEWTSEECCEFSWHYENGVEVYSCNICGATQKFSYVREKVEGTTCEYQEKQTTKWFNKDGQLLFETYDADFNEYHTYVSAFELMGQTCQDGYYVYCTCVDCGHSYEDTYESASCEAWLVDRELVYANDAICAPIYICHYRCACGNYEYYDCDTEAHNFTWLEPDENQQQSQQCVDCGLVWEDSESYQRIPQACYQIVSETNVFKLDGEEVASVTRTRQQTDHIYIYTYNLLGQTCEDGYTVSYKCAYCDAGDTYDEVCYGHENRRIAYYQWPEGTCSGAINLYACACGYNTHREYDYIYCEFLPIIPEGAEDDNSEWCRCEECGLVRHIASKRVESTDPCVKLYETTYRLYDGDELLVDWTYTERQSNHRYVYGQQTLESEEAGCDGGWSAVVTCLTCGYSYETMGSECYYNVVEREIVSTEDMCGQLEKLTYRCACGKVEDVDMSWLGDASCDYEHTYFDPDMGADKYVCETCGSYFYNVCTRERIEGTTCQYLRQWRHPYYNKAGQFLGEDCSHEYYEDHTNSIYSYVMNGETCDEGFDVYYTCLDCDKYGFYTSDSGCSNYRVGREVAYDGEGLCSPIYLDHERCACGEYESYDFYTGGHDWNDGICEDCGLKWESNYEFQRIPNTCRGISTRTATFTVNGEVIAKLEKSWEDTEHIYIYSYDMMGDSCEDGYLATYKCAYCDAGDAYSGHGHNTHQIAYYDLSDVSCGGWFGVQSCACGKNSYVERAIDCDFESTKYRTEIDKNGVRHEFTEYTCDDCDFSYVFEYYDMKGEATCERVVTRVYTFKKGDWEASGIERNVYESHNYQIVSIELQPGATDCSEGTMGIQRCADCGDEVSFSSEGHGYRNIIETIDLSAFGATCGATLNLTQCACGKYNNYELSEAAREALDVEPIDEWIEGAITDSQYTAQGYVNVESESWMCTCALTDPACDMKFRVSRYYLQEGCEAVQYETWQLGYDPETGDYLEEITIATGERITFHTYEYTYIEETVDGYRVFGSHDVCSKCGSSYTCSSYRDADNNEIKYVREAINTLKNGENKKCTWINEYVYYFGYQYTAFERYEIIYGDGSTYWNQYVWTYDFENGCAGTRTYSDSDGETWSGQEGDYHHTYTEYEYVKDSTCTQHGEYIQKSICRVCGETVREHHYQSDPIAHDWEPNGEDMMVCTICGLENANGASGEIVMEDLTDTFHNGYYVIGYWNRGEVAFNPYVSLVLYDVEEGENDEIVLSGIEFIDLTVNADGVCGLAFSQEAVDDAIATAIGEALYAGEFAVRITFVPVNGESTLDYAITFDTMMAK